ncbi:TfoX/Sxy family DNA transformation protein [Erwinia sp. 9145]|uniref:TfoX/Sxy family DNA transformation protein n=1 Tax=Erwinia sp. 9145 TaxID=1500895 RepID=UPI000555F25C|nr:TfoX/Sxy family DNA transformation protein [Erwinia sp. 9145]
MYHSKIKIAQAKQELIELGNIDSRSQFGGYSLAIDKVVFALVSEGELYLRACEQVKPYLIEHNMQPLCLKKRGIPIILDYYRVDSELWKAPGQLLTLSQLCLEGARQQRALDSSNIRLKDLPNLSIRIEHQLRRVGIDTVERLKQEGAKACWLRLRASNTNLSLNVLYALEGAIRGHHCQALPQSVKDELFCWYCQTV